MKRVKASNIYKKVDLWEGRNNWLKWRSLVNGNGKYFDTEREAALHVDKMLIEKGKEPINILLRK